MRYLHLADLRLWRSFLYHTIQRHFFLGNPADFRILSLLSFRGLGPSGWGCEAGLEEASVGQFRHEKTEDDHTLRDVTYLETFYNPIFPVLEEPCN